MMVDTRNHLMMDLSLKKKTPKEKEKKHWSLACAWMLKQLRNVSVNFANVHEMFCPVEYTQSPTVHDWSLSDS